LVLYLIRHIIELEVNQCNICYRQDIELTIHQKLSSDPLLITTYRKVLEGRDSGKEHGIGSFSQSCSICIRQLHSYKGVSPKVVPYVNHINIIFLYSTMRFTIVL